MKGADTLCYLIYGAPYSTVASSARAGVSLEPYASMYRFANDITAKIESRALRNPLSCLLHRDHSGFDLWAGVIAWTKTSNLHQFPGFSLPHNLAVNHDQNYWTDFLRDHRRRIKVEEARLVYHIVRLDEMRLLEGLAPVTDGEIDSLSIPVDSMQHLSWRIHGKSLEDVGRSDPQVSAINLDRYLWKSAVLINIITRHGMAQFETLVDIFALTGRMGEQAAVSTREQRCLRFLTWYYDSLPLFPLPQGRDMVSSMPPTSSAEVTTRANHLLWALSPATGRRASEWASGKQVAVLLPLDPGIHGNVDQTIWLPDCKFTPLWDGFAPEVFAYRCGRIVWNVIG